MHTLEIGPADILIITSEKDYIELEAGQKIARAICEKLALVGVAFSPDRILILSRGMNLMTINGPPSPAMEMATVKAADLDALTSAALTVVDNFSRGPAGFANIRALRDAAMELHRGTIPASPPPKNETHV